VANRETELIRWVIENRRNLNLEVTRFSWIDNTLPGYFDFAVHICIEGIKAVGRGVAVTEEVAFGKAVSEAIERWAMLTASHVKSSNGFAAHWDSNVAAMSAADEIIERDAFLCHFLTKTPFQLLNHENEREVRIESCFRQAMKNFGDKGMEFKIGKMRTANGKMGIVVSVKGQHAIKPFGLFVSCSLSDELENAIQKSLISCFTHVSMSLSGTEVRPMSKVEFLADPVQGVDEHLAFAAHLDQAGMLDDLWTTENEQEFSDDTSIEVCIEPYVFSGFLSTAPLHVYRASSSQLQDLYFGVPSPADLNLKRLAHFCGRDFKVPNLVNCIHPFA
jgi:hypothetical protein